jgi:hypothetical protein
MAIEGFNCKIHVKPMAEWVNNITEEQCPPCLLTPTAEWYLTTLKEGNETKAIGHLQEAWNTSDVPTIASAMDKIKEEVAPPVKDLLIELDCLAQQEG